MLESTLSRCAKMLRSGWTVSIAVGLILSAYFNAPASATDKNDKSVTPAQTKLEEIIGWLDPQSETLVVDREFQVSDERVSDLSISSCFSDVCRIVAPLSLLGKTVVLAVEGTRQFQTPDTAFLGLIPYKGCYVFCFESGFRSENKVVLAEMHSKAESEYDHLHHHIFVIWDQEDGILWHYYATFVDDHTLLCSVDRESIETALSRLIKRPKTVAFPHSLPEWKYISEGRKCWGIRHFCRTTPLDPTSPFNHGSDWGFLDQNAIGLAFQENPKSEIVYLSTNAAAAKRLRRRWNLTEGFKVQSSVQQLDKGAILIKMENSSEHGSWMMLLLQALGHYIAI
jgi:hypothetical protein